MKQFLTDTDRSEIPLVVIGFDFRSASSELREKLITERDERQNIYHSIKNIDETAAFIVLETCNRIEWIISTRIPQWITDIISAWMLTRWQTAFQDISDFPAPYIHTGKNAVIHVLKVVLGMESLAVGESQIAGQFQWALNVAQEQKTSSPVLNRLGHIAGRIAKSGYRIGFRSNHKQGIHGLVVKYLQSQLEKRPELKNMAVAGMGTIGKKTATLMEESFQGNIVKLNRTVAPEHHDVWMPLSELPKIACDTHVMVIATGGRRPVIDHDDLSLKDRKNPLLIMDIGVPRQVTSDVVNHPNVEYHNIDDLMCICEESHVNNQFHELETAIEKELAGFKQFCQTREMTEMLAHIHNGRREFTEEYIPRFVSSYFDDLDPKDKKNLQEAMKKLLTSYSNRMFEAFYQSMETFWKNNGAE